MEAATERRNLTRHMEAVDLPTGQVIPFLRNGILDLNLAAPEANENPAPEDSATNAIARARLLDPAPHVAMPPRIDGPHGLPALGAIEEDEELTAVPHMSIHGAELLIWARRHSGDGGSNAPPIRYVPLDIEAVPSVSERSLVWATLDKGVSIFDQLRQRPPLTVYVGPLSVFSGYLGAAA